MKIVCSTCKKVLGLQRPYDKHTEVEGKCTECFQKEKEEAARREAPPLPGERKEIKFENGLTGFLTVAEEGEKLSFGELIFSGKRLHCGEKNRDKLIEHFEMIDGEQADVTFLHSSSIKLDSPPKRRKKKQESALMMFDNTVERVNAIAKIFAEIIIKAEKEKQLDLSKTNEKSA